LFFNHTSYQHCIYLFLEFTNIVAAMSTPASFLAIPCELRNAIYFYIFNPTSLIDTKSTLPSSNPLSILFQPPQPSNSPTSKPNQPLDLLLTCHQIHTEAHLLALSLSTFYLNGSTPYPPNFALRATPLRPAKLAAIRHITLETRIASLRAMNETWSGLPFGNPHLNLETLTIVPTRAQCSGSAYAEVADLSQSHTLAYVFAETLKRLRNVGVVLVENRGCFNEVVWRLLYRSTVYRLWRWGGGRCGVRFESSGDESGGGEEWFRVWLREGQEGNECGEEVMRLVGGAGEMPSEVGDIGL